MSETQLAKGEDAEQGGRRGSGKLGWIIVALGAGGLGAAMPYALPAHLRPGPSHAAAAPSAPPSPAAHVLPAYVDFGEVVVNIDEGRLNRYLRVSITLQVNATEKEEIKAKLETHRAVLKNWLLSYLSDKDMEDIRGATGQNRLRREIQDQFNTVLFPDGYDRIQQVLFQEFNIQ